MEFFQGLIAKITGWIDRIFANFEGYSSKYSEFFVYGLLIFLLGKMLKIKINFTK